MVGSLPHLEKHLIFLTPETSLQPLFFNVPIYCLIDFLWKENFYNLIFLI